MTHYKSIVTFWEQGAMWNINEWGEICKDCWEMSYLRKKYKGTDLAAALMWNKKKISKNLQG